MVEDDPSLDVIPLKEYSGELLNKVFEFCEHILTHAPPSIEKPLKHNDLRYVCDIWYVSYIDVELDLI